MSRRLSSVVLSVPADVAREARDVALLLLTEDLNDLPDGDGALVLADVSEDADFDGGCHSQSFEDPLAVLWRSSR